MKKYIFILISILLPLTAFSAEVYFDAPNENYLNQPFSGQVYVSLEKESNAVEGVLYYPDKALEVESINDGNSKINFWIVKPSIQSPGQISFSGITPGGFNGEKNLLFSVKFIPKRTGPGQISLRDLKVLLNDGNGTEDKINVKNLDFSVLKEGTPETTNAVKDTELPESFEPEISRNPFLFDGKWFIAFSTQDKSSGIKSYEIKESRQWIMSFFDKYSPVESPYVLSDQDLHSLIFVKAIDFAGNKRVELISARYPLIWYQNSSYWIIIIL